MLPSPSPSPSHALDDTTNTPKRPRRSSSPTPWSKLHHESLPTPPLTARKSQNAIHTSPTKRRRISQPFELEDDSSEESSSEEEDDEHVDRRNRHQYRKIIPFNILDGCYTSQPGSRLRQRQLSTLPILRSFVSSNKTDIYRFNAVASDDHFSPAYVCAYSNDSRNSASSRLAVATEEGSVHILNTAKRDPWDCEPQRSVFTPHDNGIFDLKWSNDDTQLATVSGDQSARITDASTGELTHILAGHSSTVKCISWDPNNTHLLSTGGRDGTICIWDLRLSGSREGAGTTETLDPVISIGGAHEDRGGRRKRAKPGATAKSVTALVYPSSRPHTIVSSGTFDGILNAWDIRIPKTRRKGTVSKAIKPKTCIPVFSTPVDPTTLGASRRARGIASMLVSPTDPNTVFALGTDSHIHKYSLTTLDAYQDSTTTSHSYTHPDLASNSFYLRLCMSPCGRWLATGRAAGARCPGVTSNIFMFDAAGPCREGVVLRGGQLGEIGCLDWAADGALAACADDGTVRVWRPDQEQREKCLENPKDNQHLWQWLKDD